MARILFVNQYYWPDVASTGQHLTDLAEHLAAAGHEVRVVCSRGRYLEGRGDAPRRETHNGVEIVRVGGTRFGQRRGFAARVLDYAVFHAAALRRVAFGSWAEVIVTLTTPPLVGLWGALAKRLRGVRHVAWCMDLHPEAEFRLGMVRERSVMGRVLARLARLEVTSCDRVVALGPYQGALVAARGVEPSRIVRIPVWSAKDEVAPLAHTDNPLRAEFGWQDRFVVLYSGNAGLVHRFEELLDAAEELASRAPDVLFAFVGGGPRRAWIEAKARERGLANVEFRPYLPREALRHSLPAGDVHFVSLAPEQAGVAVPGKLYGTLAAGRPVLFVGAEHCEHADALREHECGRAFTPGQGKELARAILELRADRDLRERLGRNARNAFLARYELSVACAKWSALIDELTGAGEPARAAATAPLLLPRERRSRALDAVPAALPAGRAANHATPPHPLER